MSGDDPSDTNRRTVLKRMAAGAVGASGLLAATSGSAAAADADRRVLARGDLDAAEAAEKLRELDDAELFEESDPCYTETKCTGTSCGYQGAVAYRKCCPALGGCTSWTYTGLCC